MMGYNTPPLLLHYLLPSSSSSTGVVSTPEGHNDSSSKDWVCAGDIRGIQAWAAAGCRDILPHPFSPPRLPDAHLHFPRAQTTGLTHDGGMSLTLRALPIDVHVCSWVTAWMSTDNNMWSQPSFLRLHQQGWQSDDWHRETKAPGKKARLLQVGSWMASVENQMLHSSGADGTQDAVARGYLFNMAARLFRSGLHNVSMCSVLKFLFEKENCYRVGIVLLSHVFF